ncbi:MAG TPA: AmmeMemoRadiSam system protein B [bacterium]|nr:AmmeMemoRadiSam system protein B [bacterium]
MLTLGIISPHPPIIIPEIGQDRPDFHLVKPTIEALEIVAKKIGEKSPDKIIIISPHEKHGFDVPLYYLSKHVKPQVIIEKILVDKPSYKYYYDLGKNYDNIHNNQQKIVVIASGDLSHVLKKDGPYGFNENGPILDKIIADAIKQKNPELLLNIPNEIINEGAECGLRSILFLLGVFHQTKYNSNILSYQSPYGIGYLTAIFEPI